MLGSMGKWWKLIAIAAGLLVLALVVGCAPTPAQPPAPKTGAKPIKIGLPEPLTGPAATYGNSVKVTADFAVEDINKAGGINGSPVELVIFDSPFDPKQAITGIRKFADEKVVAIVGPFETAEVEVGFPLCKQLLIPCVSATVSKPGLPAASAPWTFSTMPDSDSTTPPLVEAFKKKYPNLNKVVIVGDVSPICGACEVMARTVYPRVLKEKGFQVVDSVYFEAPRTDFSAIVTKIKGMNPEIIAWDSIVPEALAFGKEYAGQGLKAPMMQTEHTSLAGEVVPAVMGAAANGWVFAGIVDPGDPKLQDMVKRYNAAADKNPNIMKPLFFSFEALTYDTLMILADIMRKNNVNGDTDLQKAREIIRDGLKNLKGYKGLGATYTMTGKSVIEWPDPVVFVAQDGKYVRFK